MFLIAREGGREVLWLSAGENLCATSSTFAGRRHMIGKVVTGRVAILPYHTATQDRGSECRDFGFISRIVTALIPISIRYSTVFYISVEFLYSVCVDLLITLLCFTHNLLIIDKFTVKKNNK